MKKLNFTKDAINRLKSAESRYTVGDTKVAGLILRVSPTGTKTYQVYKKLNGKPKRVTLGRFPDLTVEQAKKKAEKIIGDMAYSGTDHNAEKRQQRAQSVTLGKVFDDYQDASKLRPNTLASYKLAVDRDFKDWKNKPLNKITGLMVQQRHKKLGKESETSANKAMRVLRALFNFAQDQYEDAEGHSHFPDNPTRKLKRQWNRESRRKGYIKPDELKNWWQTTEAIKTTRKGTKKEQVPVYKGGDANLACDYLQFVILTGLRRREASSLTWDNVDIRNKCFTIPYTKNHEPLELPLTDHLIVILERRKTATGGKGRVFPIEEVKRFVEWVRKESDVYFTIHDLRRTFITIAESLDIGVLTIKALVNHRLDENDVTGGYAQINTERLREPMERITNFILSTAGIRKSADIIDLNTGENKV